MGEQEQLNIGDYIMWHDVFGQVKKRAGMFLECNVECSICDAIHSRHISQHSLFLRKATDEEVDRWVGRNS